MSRLIDEQISALLDGELPGEQEAMLLRRLASEPARRDTLARYGLIGDLVRGAGVERCALSISGRVATALDIQAAEATANGPVPSSWVGSGYVGAGVAASIALLVVFALADIGATRTQAPDPGAGTALLAQSAALPADSLRLTRYLVAHAQFSNTASRQLVNSHVAMPIAGPADWASYE